MIQPILKNKKGASWLANDWVVATILASAGFALFFLMVQGMAAENNAQQIVDQTFSDDFDKLAEQRGIIDTMLGEVQSGDGLSLVGTFDVLFTAAFSVINLVWTGLTSVQSQMASFGTQFNIPKPVTNILFGAGLSIIIAVLIFVVISSVSRREL